MSLFSLVKDVMMIVLGILLVLGLFAFQHFLGIFRDGLSEEGLTGKVIIIESPGGQPPSPPPNITIPSPSKPLVTHPQLQCLMQGGVTSDDIEVGGMLLEGIPCPPSGPKQAVIAAIQNNCLDFQIGVGLGTSFCFDDKGVDFAVKVESGVEGVESLPLPHMPQYRGWVLFVLFLVALVFVWREYELREQSLKEREQERQRHFELPQEQVDVRMIKAAPLYKEIVSEEEKLLSPEDVEEVHRKLVEEQRIASRAPPLTLEDVGEYIRSFNAIGKEISEYLREGKLNKARKRYLLLFPLYTRLYYSVDETQKRELVEVIKYLHDQLNIMEKSRKIRHLIEEAYRSVDQHRIDREQQRENMVVLRDDRDVQQKEVQHAEQFFSALGREEKEKKPIIKELHQRDVLEEIERIHERVKQERLAIGGDEALVKLQRELDDLKKLVYGKESKKLKKV